MNEMQTEKDTTHVCTYAKGWKVHNIIESKSETRILQGFLSTE
jgi:hypothetical protein